MCLVYFLFAAYIAMANAYKVCIVGGSSRLGRELIYQSTIKHRFDTVALVGSKNPIKYPVRVNNLIETRNRDIFNDPKLDTLNFWNDKLDEIEYEHIIFTLCAPPFKNDYSDKVMEKIIETLPKKCKSITLIHTSQFMDWFIKDTIRANKKKEKIARDTDVKTIILRPTSLSNEGPNARSVVAKKIFNIIINKHLFNK